MNRDVFFVMRYSILTCSRLRTTSCWEVTHVSVLHLFAGSKPAGGGKPLHWTSCLKIAEDLAAGLVHLHEVGLVHGNLKSSNVLLGSDFESCLTDYGLHVLRSPEDTEEGATSTTALFYRAPECRHPSKPPTEKSDVYSFGVLLVELLTGKTPFPDLIQEPGPEIVSWVRSVREEEGESGDDPLSGNEASEEKLNSLLNIAISCVSPAAGSRPVIKEVLKMIKETRGETHVSSNSSDHSPGRWSDTVQSLPDYTERDWSLLPASMVRMLFCVHICFFCVMIPILELAAVVCFSTSIGEFCIWYCVLEWELHRIGTWGALWKVTELRLEHIEVLWLYKSYKQEDLWHAIRKIQPRLPIIHLMVEKKRWELKFNLMLLGGHCGWVVGSCIDCCLSLSQEFICKAE